MVTKHRFSKILKVDAFVDLTVLCPHKGVKRSKIEKREGIKRWNGRMEGSGHYTLNNTGTQSFLYMFCNSLA